MVDKLKPWLFIPPQLAHDAAPYLLRAASKLMSHPQKFTWSPVKWQKLHFSNPLGIAGGVDKSAQSVRDWWRWGPGFVEVGTITPEPQLGNPGKVMARDVKRQAVWNRMGFPSKGLNDAALNLAKIKRPHVTPIFANIGKNRSTTLRGAPADYTRCIRALFEYVDGFVVNISSPNTEGLRRLAEPENLKDFLEPIIETNKTCHNRYHDGPVPVLLKVSPDMKEDDLETLLNSSLNLGIDGWILNNTSAAIRSGLNFPSDGGVSGQPLADRSKQLLKKSLEILGGDRDGKLIISCGGVMTPQDVFERLEMGADLVQVYSALIFSGPFFFKKVAREAVIRPKKPTENLL